MIGADLDLGTLGDMRGSGASGIVVEIFLINREE